MAVGARVGSRTAVVGGIVAVGVTGRGSVAHPAITRTPASRNAVLNISKPPMLQARQRKFFRCLPVDPICILAPFQGVQPSDLSVWNSSASWESVRTASRSPNIM